MKLTLVIHSMTAGGAERVLSLMANYWATQGWQITLLTFNDSTIPTFFSLDSRISYIPLGIAQHSSNAIVGIWNNWQRIRKLRCAIRMSQPDAVVSFMSTTNVTTLLATRWLNIPVVVSERSNPIKSSLSRSWKQLRLWVYPFADRIVFQTKRALECFPPQLQTRACVIPNPVLSPTSLDESPKPSQRSILAVGRLVPEKGYDVLLQAFAQLKERFPEWTLTILGDGSLRSELEQLIRQLQLVDRVRLLGEVCNPHGYLRQADLFVLSSRFEGFPNALCEAMAIGLPVIATNCPNGPQEIIRDGVDGLLVPNEDVAALASAMAHLMAHETERHRVAARASEVIERFSLEKIMEMWNVALKEVVFQ